MARNIYCKKCHVRVQGYCLRFGGFIESIKGKPLCSLNCDNCGDELKEGQDCYACCLLDQPTHPNYDWQKPSVWAEEYIKPE